MENRNQDTGSANALTAEVFLKNWQQTGLRILRAQERMLQGVASVARLEMQFGRELMENRLAMLKWGGANGEQRTTGPAQEIEKLTFLMREVTEELRSGFAEASQMLREGASQQLQETIGQASEAMKTNIGKGAEMFNKTSNAGTEMMNKSVAQGQETVSKAGEAMQKNLDAGKEISKDAASKAAPHGSKPSPGDIGAVPPKSKN